MGFFAKDKEDLSALWRKYDGARFGAQGPWQNYAIADKGNQCSVLRKDFKLLNLTRAHGLG